MQSIIQVLGMVLTVIRWVATVTVILLFVYMLGAVMAQVIGRYVFQFSIAGATETATMAQIWMVLLGAGIAMRRRLHVGVDILVTMLPRRAIQILNVIVTIMCLWFLWVVFSGSMRLLQIGQFTTSPAVGIPMVYPYLAIPVGAAYFALEFLVAMLEKTFGDEDPSGDDSASRSEMPQ